MTKCKVRRTIRSVVENIENIDATPKFKLHDCLEVYNGHYEGHNFYVKDIRYDADHQEFQYMYEFLGPVWLYESQLVRA
jgi:hypothetical protein